MKINGYTLVEPPMQGGMALVYKGEKGSFRRAFKLVRPDKAANNPKLCQKFLQEIQYQAQLDHENIVKILDAYQYTDDRGVRATVLEMEWLNGLDLQRYIEQKAPKGIGKEEAIRIAKQVLEGLIYAHRHKILHLDIKPSNLFRTTDGFIKIIDFGIARVVGENADIVDGAERMTLVTETGESTFRGTMAYASPEQQVGGKIGYTSDIYSFGKTLHFLCTGSTDPSIEVSDSLLNDIITKCTLQNPKQRYQSFEEVRQALSISVSVEKCPYCHSEISSAARFCPQCGKPVKTPPPPPPKPRCPKCNAILEHRSALCLSCGWDAEAGVYRQVAGYKCLHCNEITKAYSDGVNFCNHCGASKENLMKVYK